MNEFKRSGNFLYMRRALAYWRIMRTVKPFGVFSPAFSPGRNLRMKSGMGASVFFTVRTALRQFYYLLAKNIRK